MPFQWDENKNTKNIARHHLDFMDAPLVWEGPIIIGNAKTVQGEGRFAATGLLDDVYVTVIHTLRGDDIRIISFRRARHDERKRHQDLHGS